MAVAFVLLPTAASPDPTRIADEAAKLGIRLRATGATDPLTFDIEGGGWLAVMTIAARYPEADELVAGTLSPPLEAMTSAPAHAIVTATDLPGGVRDVDTQMAALTAAVVRATGAIAAKLGHGIFFQRGELFADLADLGAEHGALPVEGAIDVSMAPEEEGRMSMLTHGMQRYGREELFVTCSVNGKGALGFVFDMARWFLSEPKPHVPTGDTVGRNANERLKVQRVASPLGTGPDVIRLDLPG